jgi:hypothetical protein
LEELAFLFEDSERAEEAKNQVEEQMKWSERRFSHIGERMSWEMDVFEPNKTGHDRGGSKNSGVQQNLRRGDWWED